MCSSGKSGIFETRLIFVTLMQMGHVDPLGNPDTKTRVLEFEKCYHKTRFSQLWEATCTALVVHICTVYCAVQALGPLLMGKAAMMSLSVLSKMLDRSELTWNF